MTIIDYMIQQKKSKLANRQGQPKMMMKKKYSIANKIKAKYFMRNRHASKNKKKSGRFLRICKGKRGLEPSNNITDQMDVDEAPAVHFQEEIIMNILSRLPVRSLHQCKCVSKFWNKLISDPYFKMKHFMRAKNDPNSQKFLITYMHQNESRFSSYYCPLSSVQMVEDAQKLVHPLSSQRLFMAMCACDGLVVVIVSDIISDRRPMHLLWNPSIRESIVLPTPEFGTVDSHYGFGYDSTSGDYKILRICSVSGEILALKGGSWRKIDKHPHGVCNAVTRTGSLAFVHEAFHWIGSSRDCRARNYSVVSFSISKEEYGDIPLPEQILSFVGKIYLGVSILDGMLWVNSVTFLRGFETFKLWVLKDYGVKESWSAMFTIEDPSIFSVLPEYRFADGELLFKCVQIPSGWPEFRTSSGPFVPWLQASLVAGVAFSESLISPKSLTY